MKVIDEDVKPGNVIEVDFQRPLLVTGTSNRRESCLHRQKMVDRRKRTVECTSCGAFLDPLDALADVAADGSNLLWARRELARINKRIAELKEEEKRVKARLRRAKKKDPGP